MKKQGENQDVTILKNKMMPKSWKCPHCGKRSRTGEQANNILMQYGRYLDQCGRCGYLHCWKLELTEDFKKGVVEMLKEACGIGAKK